MYGFKLLFWVVSCFRIWGNLLFKDFRLLKVAVSLMRGRPIENRNLNLAPLAVKFENVTRNNKQLTLKSKTL